MPRRRSLFNQFNQVRGSLNFDDVLPYYETLAETAGRSYLSGTLAVVSGSTTVTDSSNVFESLEQNNFIVIDSGDAAGTYQITASGTIGNNNASITPEPTGTDATASYRRHYYKNLEDDLNYLRTMLNLVIGENNWYDEPNTDLSSMAYLIPTLDTKIDTTSGTLQSAIDSMGEAHDTFIELTDTISSFTDQRVLFTTASGVTDSADFTFDSSTGTLSTEYLDLELGGTVNEITTTVVSGSTDGQLPTAKAVWDITEAAAAAVHTHYDVDATHVSDTSWTYGTGFSATPDGLQIFVNGVKQRIGSDYDCTVAVPGGILTTTFTYSVRTSDWVNLTYYA
jgi:hypothetical protein